ncbi:Adaptive-response sensory-kinase SasA [Streptomyces sp. RB5]|uniref:histidine kinase n=1 Tax=Streptomyces smaragdinus TaxID=2585196 RepID=A0A7K0CRT0_9ACTN|nr:ATP-binding protein [Streptomyces smaragdinus]MQY16053.1 Adaptive-response sensory-kinase SasA [Streptomyces smaragdinus]
MSFRLRALALLTLVALAATAATAWLTLRQVNRQVRDSVTAGRQETARITGELRAYGWTHGTWAGVSPVIAALARDTGQRIRVATQDGVLLADSDALAGRTPRAVSTQPPLLVDPRPTLRLPAGMRPQSKPKLTSTALVGYRATATYAACLTANGARVTAAEGDFGMPVITSDAKIPGCARTPDTGTARIRADLDVLGPCATGPRPDDCLQRAFDDLVTGTAPPGLQITLGVRDEAPPTLAAAPTAAVAAGVALAAILGALGLSRAVLRPVRALTAAARDVGEGDLARRVPVSGRDEIAELGRAFNRMAGSVQSAEERQRRLTGDIAHELRTPLANLRGYLEALRDGVLEPTPELLDSLHGEAVQQQRIVDDLQDLALAEAGALTYHRADVPLDALLEGCRRAYAAQAAAAGVALEVSAGEPVRVHADAGRLRQVVGNLLTNALRHTGPGGTVTLRLTRDGARAVVEVADTGSGIAAEDLPYVFDRFWRADAARGRDTGGSGLGLSIARQIVVDHGGTIGVGSTTGTVFTVALPAVTDSPAPPSGPGGPPVPPDTGPPPRRSPA